MAAGACGLGAAAMDASAGTLEGAESVSPAAAAAGAGGMELPAEGLAALEVDTAGSTVAGMAAAIAERRPTE